VSARRVILSVQPPDPLRDVVLVPVTLSGRPEADMARAIVADVETPSAAEVDGRRRQILPFAPLNAAALPTPMKLIRGGAHRQQ
jgi:hypothetical protein